MRFGMKSILESVIWLLLVSMLCLYLTEFNIYVLLFLLFITFIESIFFKKIIHITDNELVFTKVLMPYRRKIFLNLSEITCVELEHITENYTNATKRLLITTATSKVKLLIYLNKKECRALMDKLMEKNIRVIYPLYSFD
ncbi:hypothetical protein CAP35_14705 [Chitinophagaceae bacterium IBVUCB1]|nr:hypothetical protein CAP35_14705 [Chitinophagaceae bacterium IBVUCB1]